MREVSPDKALRKGPPPKKERKGLPERVTWEMTRTKEESQPKRNLEKKWLTPKSSKDNVKSRIYQ